MYVGHSGTMALMATAERPRSPAATHEALNQATPLEDYNTYESDRVLVETLRREGGEARSR